MGLFGWGKKAPIRDTSPQTCPHVALVPHWDSVEAMGKEDQADKYACDGCGAAFSPAEARELRSSEEARLQELVEKRIG